MTDIVFMVVDNHRTKALTNYNILFKSKNIKDFNKYIRQKGLVK